MNNQKNNMSDKITFTYTFSLAGDSLKLLGGDDKYSKVVLHKIVTDAADNSDTQLGDYYQNTLRYLINAIPVRNRVLMDCAKWLQKADFSNFSVLKIFVRYRKKEIMVVSDKMNDRVLDEFYNKTFEYAYKKDDEIVFMIADEKSIDYSAMPKYDKITEVVKNEYC